MHTIDTMNCHYLIVASTANLMTTTAPMSNNGGRFKDFDRYLSIEAIMECLSMLLKDGRVPAQLSKARGLDVNEELSKVMAIFYFLKASILAYFIPSS